MKKDRCSEGEQFYQAWTHAIKQQSEPLVRQHTASQYFHHKNTCRQCCGINVIFLHHHTPTLFKKVNNESN